VAESSHNNNLIFFVLQASMFSFYVKVVGGIFVFKILGNMQQLFLAPKFLNLKFLISIVY
jgi:hypothetical protein